MCGCNNCGDTQHSTQILASMKQKCQHTHTSSSSSVTCAHYVTVVAAVELVTLSALEITEESCIMLQSINMLHYPIAHLSNMTCDLNIAFMSCWCEMCCVVSGGSCQADLGSIYSTACKLLYILFQHCQYSLRAFGLTCWQCICTSCL